MSNEYEIGILEHSIIKEANLTPNYLYDYGTILIKNQLSQHSKDLVNGVIDERVTTSITDLNDKNGFYGIDNETAKELAIAIRREMRLKSIKNIFSEQKP
jgi:hypothetical protein